MKKPSSLQEPDWPDFVLKEEQGAGPHPKPILLSHVSKPWAAPDCEDRIAAKKDKVTRHGWTYHTIFFFNSKEFPEKESIVHMKITMLLWHHLLMSFWKIKQLQEVETT